MSLLQGIKAIHPSGVSNRPHVLGYQSARSDANDTLLEIWNGSTNAARKFAVDKDGKPYSAAWTAGDVPYVVAGGVSSLKRMDTLPIGTPAQVMVVNSGGTAPEWASSVALAATATALATPRTINGTSFDGTANITVTAAAGTLTGTTLAATVVTSSLTSVGTLTALTVDGTLTVSSGQTLVLTGATVNGAPTWGSTQTLNTSGNAATATALATPRTINGTSFDGTINITVTAAAGTLTGTVLNATVVTSSLTAVGTLTDLAVTNTITGSISGNAATATVLQTTRAINGVSFDGSGDITVTAAAGTLTGTTLNSTVVTSSLTTVGTLVSLAVTGNVNAGGQVFSPKHDIGASSTSVAFNCDNGNYQRTEATGNFELVITNEQPGASYVLEIEADGTQRTVTWTLVDWGNGGNPTMPTTVTDKIYVTLLCIATDTFLGSWNGVIY